MREFTVTGLSRQEALFLWMRRKGLTNRELCGKLRLSEGVMSVYLRGDEIPTTYHKMLVDLGIPPEYLPNPVDKKRGYPARRVLA